MDILPRLGGSDALISRCLKRTVQFKPDFLVVAFKQRYEIFADFVFNLSNLTVISALRF